MFLFFMNQGHVYLQISLPEFSSVSTVSLILAKNKTRVSMCGIIVGKWVISHILCDMLKISHRLLWTYTHDALESRNMYLGTSGLQLERPRAIGPNHPLTNKKCLLIAPLHYD